MRQMLDTAKSADYSPSVSDTAIRAPCGRYSLDPAEIKSRHGGRRPGAGRKAGGSGKADPASILPRRLGSCWYCVRTGAQAEQLRADIAIRLAGFELFNPSIFKPATSPRRIANVPPRRGLPDRVLPLFPRYLFARFDTARDDWMRIASLPGVERIMANTPGNPVPVPQEAIEAIRALCQPNGCIYPAQDDPRPFFRGDRLAVLLGPLAGLRGICQSSDRSRVALLLDIMGSAIRVSLTPQAVRHIERA